jgi:hypothetical protein
MIEKDNHTQQDKKENIAKLETYEENTGGWKSNKTADNNQSSKFFKAIRLIDKEIIRCENLMKDKKLKMDDDCEVAIKLRHYKEIRKKYSEILNGK